MAPGRVISPLLENTMKYERDREMETRDDLIGSSEHSVQVVITEQGIADLRGKSPAQRARAIIENCAHPDYRGLLRDYVSLAGNSHSPQTLSAAFAFHLAFTNKGDMRLASFQV